MRTIAVSNRLLPKEYPNPERISMSVVRVASERINTKRSERKKKGPVKGLVFFVLTNRQPDVEGGFSLFASSFVANYFERKTYNLLGYLFCDHYALTRVLDD